MPLQRFQPLDVVLHHLAPRAGPPAGDRVRRRDDERFDRLRLLLVVVRGDGVDDPGRPAEPLGDLRADQGVRPLDLVVDGLADVVQEAAVLATLTSAPISAAIPAAMIDASSECCSTFWP